MPGHVQFFAAVPPAGVVERIAAAWAAVGTPDFFRRSVLHLTLLPLAGDGAPPPADLAERADWGLRQLMATPFTLVLDRLATFHGRPDSGRRPIVLYPDKGVEPARALAAQIRDAATRGGVGAVRRRLDPHVTLAYGEGFAGERPLADPIAWRIDEVVLIDSLQGQTRHDILGRWKLG